MKITRHKTTKEHFFAEIKVGDIFVSDDDCYLKITEKNKLCVDDYKYFNAIAIEDWTYSYFEGGDEVIPVKSELIIEE